MLYTEKKRTAFRLSLVLVMGFLASASTLAAAQYKQRNLVGDVKGTARHIDPNLKNGWGLAFFPNGPFLGGRQHDGRIHSV